MKLNVCCGMDYREGYINIDFANIGSDGNPIKVDLICNVLKDGLPYMEEADEIVFRESLEHFNRWNGLDVLRSLYHALKVGGILDLTVPNATKQLKILLAVISQPVGSFERAHEEGGYWKWHDDLMGATHKSDGTDGDSHKTLYTKQSLRPLLESVGFKIISIDDNIHVKATK